MPISRPAFYPDYKAVVRHVLLKDLARVCLHQFVIRGNCVGGSRVRFRSRQGTAGMLPTSGRLSWVEFAPLPFALNAEAVSGVYMASVTPASQYGPMAAIPSSRYRRRG